MTFAMKMLDCPGLAVAGFFSCKFRRWLWNVLSRNGRSWVWFLRGRGWTGSLSCLLALFSVLTCWCLIHIVTNPQPGVGVHPGHDIVLVQPGLHNGDGQLAHHILTPCCSAALWHHLSNGGLRDWLQAWQGLRWKWKRCFYQQHPWHFAAWETYCIAWSFEQGPEDVWSLLVTIITSLSF